MPSRSCLEIQPYGSALFFRKGIFHGIGYAFVDDDAERKELVGTDGYVVAPQPEVDVFKAGERIANALGETAEVFL